MKPTFENISEHFQFLSVSPNGFNLIKLNIDTFSLVVISKVTNDLFMANIKEANRILKQLGFPNDDDLYFGVVKGQHEYIQSLRILVKNFGLWVKPVNKVINYHHYYLNFKRIKFIPTSIIIEKGFYIVHKTTFKILNNSMNEKINYDFLNKSVLEEKRNSFCVLTEKNLKSLRGFEDYFKNLIKIEKYIRLTDSMVNCISPMEILRDDFKSICNRLDYLLKINK